MIIYILSFLFGVINVVDYFLCLYNFKRSLIVRQSPKSEVVIFRNLDFYRLSDLGCPDFVGTIDLGCCIPPCFLVMLARGWERTLICWYG